MKIDLSQKIFGMQGTKPIPNPDTGKDYTLKDVCMEAVLFTEINPQTGLSKATGKEKYERHELYRKLKDVYKEVDLSVDEIAEIKKCIGDLKPPLVMGQCWDYLEGTVKSPSKRRTK